MKKWLVGAILLGVFAFAPVGCAGLGRYANDPDSKDAPPVLLGLFLLVLLLWGVRKIRPRRKW